MSEKYVDIINLPHHVSSKHPRMSIVSRAAQFAPFAALVGYDKAIDKKGKETNYDSYTYESLDEWS